jgi:small-conductance mechanosensitive channel
MEIFKIDIFSWFSTPLSQWALALVALLASHFGYLLLKKTIFSIRGKTRGNHLLVESRIFSFCSIAYIIGLRLAAYFAPLPANTQNITDHVVFCITTILLFNMVQHLVFLGLESSLFQNIPSATLKEGFIPLIKNLITLCSYAGACIIIMQHFQYDVFSLVTALGVGSLAFGLASKDTLSHMIAGFILIIDRNLSQGDFIQVDANLGAIKEIGLRSTQIMLLNGSLLIVPNSDLVNNKILNLSYPHKEVRNSFYIKVSFSIPIDQIREACKRIYSEIEYAPKNYPTKVYLISFSEGYQLIEVIYWAKDAREMKKMGSEFQSRILAWIQSEKIQIFNFHAPAPTANA